jgi:hypothetical protein
MPSTSARSSSSASDSSGGASGRPVAIGHKARPVEDQLVVSADEIHEHERHVVLARGIAQHRLAQRHLGRVPRRRGDGPDHFGTARDQLLDGIDGIRPARAPELPAPHVFADRDAHTPAAELDHAPLGGGLEVARLVEDVVGREQRLGLHVRDLAAVEQHGRVRQVLRRTLRRG